MIKIPVLCRNAPRFAAILRGGFVHSIDSRSVGLLASSPLSQQPIIAIG
jgi:hypothetical protein